MLQGVAGAVLYVLIWAVFLATVYAFIHAAMQRPDAYPAVDKMTKPVWLIILGVAAALCFFFGVQTLGIFFPTIAAVAAGVYLVDVRPKLLEVQGKSR
ncbi:MAG: DUF2516 family protein [Mycobacteriaceae bacterium]